MYCSWSHWTNPDRKLLQVSEYIPRFLNIQQLVDLPTKVVNVKERSCHSDNSRERFHRKIVAHNWNVGGPVQNLGPILRSCRTIVLYSGVIIGVYTIRIYESVWPLFPLFPLFFIN
jgi:hypothetical protein